MEVVKNSYKISFSSREIQHFNKIFATLLVNLTSVDALCDFRVNCNKERIIIQAPANPEFFAFIAQIIQEIDDFEMEIKSNEVQLKETEGISKGEVSNKEVENSVIETEPTDFNFGDTLKEEEDIPEEEPQISTDNLSEEISENPTQISEINEDSESEGKRGVTKVRNYFLTLETFTVSELKKKFPELPKGAIANAIHLAKSKNLISPISRGKYAVNKN